MKYHLLSSLLLATIATFAQEDKNNVSPQLEWSPLLRISLTHPIQFGDHALAKGHDSQFGFGLSFQFLEYRKFRLGFGYDITQYNVTDEAKIGTFKNTNYTSWYGMLSYDLPVTSKICLYPHIVYGAAKLQQRTGRTLFGHQTGNDLQVGLMGNYSFDKTFSLFAGVQYIHTRLGMKTAPDYVDFFGRANQVQFSFGIQIQ